MTVNSDTTAMTSPTVPHSLQQQKTSRVSNFSVDSLLADTRPKAILTSPFAEYEHLRQKHRDLVLSTKTHLLQSQIISDSGLTANLSITSPPRLHDRNSSQLNDSSSSTSNSTTKNERHTPHSSASAESDVEYDSNADDDDDNSDIDIEAGNDRSPRQIHFFPPHLVVVVASRWH